MKETLFKDIHGKWVFKGDHVRGFDDVDYYEGLAHHSEQLGNKFILSFENHLCVYTDTAEKALFLDMNGTPVFKGDEVSCVCGCSASLIVKSTTKTTVMGKGSHPDITSFLIEKVVRTRVAWHMKQEEKPASVISPGYVDSINVTINLSSPITVRYIEERAERLKWVDSPEISLLMNNLRIGPFQWHSDEEMEAHIGYSATMVGIMVRHLRGIKQGWKTYSDTVIHIDQVEKRFNIKGTVTGRRKA